MTNSFLSPEVKRLVELADKYVRRKQYRCLIPGCERIAVKCHAIPRASLIEALAENRHVYTRNQSYTELFRYLTPSQPVEIVRTGVNEASVFKGLCSIHDSAAFRPIEAPKKDERELLFRPFHLRALLLEQMRKQRNLDYFTKFGELSRAAKIKRPMEEILASSELARNNVSWAVLGFLEEVPEFGSGPVDYVCVVLSRNLKVSCCGVFNQGGHTPESMIAYNLISYTDFSVLSLTALANEHKTLDAFLSEYNLPEEQERLLNVIAFFKGEDVIISPSLWETLDDDTKLDIRRSLVHPAYRLIQSPPNIIKLGIGELVPPIPPELFRCM